MSSGSELFKRRREQYTWRCPVCESTNIHYAKLAGVYNCNKCGQVFEIEDMLKDEYKKTAEGEEINVRNSVRKKN